MAANGGLAPRQAALRALDLIYDHQLPLGEALERAGAGLAARDAALARHLAATMLRRRGQLKDLVKRCLKRPLAKNARAAERIIMLGAAQLFFAQVPAHAAVATTVELVARDKRPAVRALKGLANAVLRRLAGPDGATWLQAQDAARLNVAPWLRRRWVAQYGAATAQAIAEAQLVAPPLDLTPKDATAAAALTAALPEAQLLPTGTVRLPSRPVSELPGYRDGQWWVEDAAAYLAAKLVRAAPTEIIVDLCAAPGGKTLALAAAGAHVTAVDSAADRLARLRENLARTGLAADVVAADALTWRPPTPADAVLLDAPCSATGTLRRHPDVALLKDDAAIATLSTVQANLLDAAASMVRPGGRLVYAVCSLEPEEGEAQITAFLERHSAWAVDPVEAAEVPGLEAAIAQAGWLRLLPCHWAERGGLDGFFIARLRRRA